MKKLLKKQKGFTLVELLVVIAILGILATVSVVGYTTYIKSARESNAKTELTEFRDMLIAEDINNPKFEIGTDKITFAVKSEADNVKTYYTFEEVLWDMKDNLSHFVAGTVGEDAAGTTWNLSYETAKNTTTNITYGTVTYDYGSNDVKAYWTIGSDITSVKPTIA